MKLDLLLLRHIHQIGNDPAIGPCQIEVGNAAGIGGQANLDGTGLPRCDPLLGLRARAWLDQITKAGALGRGSGNGAKSGIGLKDLRIQGVGAVEQGRAKGGC